MITLARNRAMSDAVLLAGDEDLRVGVQQAQEFGVRVHLVGIRPARGSQSTFLLQEADTKVEWDGAQLGAFLSRRERVDASIVVAPVVATTGLLAEVEFGALLDELTESELQALITEFEQLRGVPNHRCQAAHDRASAVRDEIWSRARKGCFASAWWEARGARVLKTP